MDNPSRDCRPFFNNLRVAKKKNKIKKIEQHGWGTVKLLFFPQFRNVQNAGSMTKTNEDKFYN